MDAIKKKMQSLKTETENSLARAEQLDNEATEANKLAEKTEEHVSERLPIRISRDSSFSDVLSRVVI